MRKVKYFKKDNWYMVYINASFNNEVTLYFGKCRVGTDIRAGNWTFDGPEIDVALNYSTGRSQNTLVGCFVADHYNRDFFHIYKLSKREIVNFVLPNII